MTVDEYGLTVDSRYPAPIVRKVDDIGLLNRPGAQTPLI
jgi:hypothetical protein